MDVQSLLDRISFLEEEVHRCYAEIEEKEVKIGLTKLRNKK